MSCKEAQGTPQPLSPMFKAGPECHPPPTIPSHSPRTLPWKEATSPSHSSIRPGPELLKHRTLRRTCSDLARPSPGVGYWTQGPGRAHRGLVVVLKDMVTTLRQMMKVMKMSR